MTQEASQERDGSTRRESGLKAPERAWLPHVALIFSFILLGLGSTIGKLGMEKFNPVLFAFLREVFAGPILAVIAWFAYRRGPGLLPLRIWGRLAFLGFCLFVTQFFFLVGLKFADSNSASAWQPSQPIISMVIAYFVGLEGLGWRKVLGILCAFSGALFLVLGKSWFQQSGTRDDGNVIETENAIIGNVFFFLNCSATACYVVFSKPLFVGPSSKASIGFQMDSMWVIALAYGFAATLMLGACLTVNNTPELLAFICQDCADKYDAWRVPRNAILPLTYWILASSVIVWLCITWANAQASCNTSVVLAYGALQPLVACVANFLLITFDLVPRGVLSLPGWNILGGIGILIGLGVIIWDASRSAKTVDESGEGTRLGLREERELEGGVPGESEEDLEGRGGEGEGESSFLAARKRGGGEVSQQRLLPAEVRGG
uniref:EamA domain-containing protein n=1 Tax=Chromera velia CCMP2878 TaxID=1169474 RepID=A0A0G4HCT3_9ALVE|eukprot:Cvel_6376.t1-p1 / transcript=Cvel_6376.t1 / gene=Cvel_6376 / organism=Chromera_velia_CCMP2878 / gene_product=WAT1-related protein At3g45870, putative / transcript_product=WAT1-related protein At3g45870, putative / location=Cvel_scaffold310:78578-80244(+) / protein_length=432 / sequence_SO=supercontig / SO=protein_coding / is_pseudo=false